MNRSDFLKRASSSRAGIGHHELIKGARLTHQFRQYNKAKLCHSYQASMTVLSPFKHTLCSA